MGASIKVVSGALDEVGGEIVLRGVIDPASLQHLQTGPYQREVLPLARINDLVEAYKNGSRPPDIELGMRGQRVIERGDAFHLQDPVYIVDGLQRVSAALHLMQGGSVVMPHLGATIHFGTTEEWERSRFRVLNQEWLKLSPNILLRNLQYGNEAVLMLHRLSLDNNFVLAGRVCWTQRMARHELITAMTYLKVIGQMHAHMGSTLYSDTNRLSIGVDKVMGNIGKNVMRDNVRTFFELVDECWGIKRVTFKEGAIYMRASFLITLARVLSQHTDFWKGERLFIEAPLKRKLAQFPVNDPNVSNLASAAGTSRNILYMLMVEHVNSGKRTRRITPRNNDYVDAARSGDEEE